MHLKFLILLAIAAALRAEDAKPLAIVHELTAKVAEQKQENERLTKMLNAYANKYQRCDQELTVTQTLGIPAQIQGRPLATPPEAQSAVAEQKEKDAQIDAQAKAKEKK